MIRTVSKQEAGLTLTELLVALAISAILVVAVLSLFFGFFQGGSQLSELDKRIANAAEVQTIADHFLRQANFQGEPNTAVTLSAPQIQNTQYTQNVGLAIQWQPVLPSNVSGPVVCEGTLVDKTLYGAQGVQVQGMEWTASQVTGPTNSQNVCGAGTSFFPVNNDWAFTLVNRSGCPNPNVNPNAVILTNNYNGNYGNVQVVTVCLPNLQ